MYVFVCMYVHVDYYFYAYRLEAGNGRNGNCVSRIIKCCTGVIEEQGER